MTGALATRSPSHVIVRDAEILDEEPEGVPPPNDLEAEAAVLSAVMLDPSALPRLVDFLRPDRFHSEAHRRIFEAALAVREAGSPVDRHTIASRLKATGRMAQVGGHEYLVQILTATSTVVNVRAHAEIVFERWRSRQIILLCQRAAAEAYYAADIQDFSERLVRAVAEIARSAPGTKTESNYESLRRLTAEMAAAEKRGATDGGDYGIPTGVDAYDRATLGLHPGEKTTLVALPRVGKTAFALQVAMHVARRGFSVAFFSTEMDRDEIAERQLAALARVDGRRIRQAKQKPTLSADEWRRIQGVMHDAQQIKYALRVYDDTGPTVDDICARAKAQAEQSMAVDGVPLGLVVVDYVQNLRRSPAVREVGKRHEIFYSTVRLKDLAAELKVPVLELAQQKNSEFDKTKGKRPRPALGDAAESAQIERSANNVAYLYRPSESDGRNVRLLLAKQRSGEEADIALTFEREFSHFAEVDPYGPKTSLSRQYVDTTPEPPPGRFDDDDDGSTTLTGGP